AAALDLLVAAVDLRVEAGVLLLVAGRRGRAVVAERLGGSIGRRGGALRLTIIAARPGDVGGGARAGPQAGGTGLGFCHGRSSPTFGWRRNHRQLSVVSCQLSVKKTPLH